jgi:hypothetical protein
MVEQSMLRSSDLVDLRAVHNILLACIHHQTFEYVCNSTMQACSHWHVEGNHEQLFSDPLLLSILGKLSISSLPLRLDRKPSSFVIFQLPTWTLVLKPALIGFTCILFELRHSSNVILPELDLDGRLLLVCYMVSKLHAIISTFGFPKSI